jgi:hypothetical protein
VFFRALEPRVIVSALFADRGPVKASATLVCEPATSTLKMDGLRLLRFVGKARGAALGATSLPRATGMMYPATIRLFTSAGGVLRQASGEGRLSDTSELPLEPGMASGIAATQSASNDAGRNAPAALEEEEEEEQLFDPIELEELEAVSEQTMNDILEGLMQVSHEF